MPQYVAPPRKLALRDSCGPSDLIIPAALQLNQKRPEEFFVIYHFRAG